jgi:EAL domain-containing protein (putative c-di-GMP-specific phosphodiesterase class I)
MSVNLCTRSLLDQELAQGIRTHLSEQGLPPSALQLEITESRMVTDLRRARGVLDELRAMGVAIAIDDFGTGFSSLTQLQRLPIDEIKIDKSFIVDWGSSEQDQAIVRSTIDLGRNLGINVTAEGVESESVYRQLGDLGCDYAQGFFLSRPASAGQCARELDRGTKGVSKGSEEGLSSVRTLRATSS